MIEDVVIQAVGNMSVSMFTIVMMYRYILPRLDKAASEHQIMIELLRNRRK